MFGQKKPARWAEELSRDYDWFKGEVGDAAIVKIWRAADTIGGDAGKLIKLVLVLGKRRGAIERMRWEQIDSTWWWNAPPGSKIKRCHSIPLSKLAQRIMSPRGEGRVLGYVDAKAIIARVRELTGIDTFIFVKRRAKLTPDWSAPPRVDRVRLRI
jgi:integrase